MKDWKYLKVHIRLEPNLEKGSPHFFLIEKTIEVIIDEKLESLYKKDENNSQQATRGFCIQ